MPIETTCIGAYPKPDFIQLPDWFNMPAGPDTTDPTMGWAAALAALMIAVSAVITLTLQNLGQARSALGEITDATLATLRAECPGWDYQTLHADFRTWIEADAGRTPVSYQNAFIGYVRRFDAKNRHTLR